MSEEDDYVPTNNPMFEDRAQIDDELGTYEKGISDPVGLEEYEAPEFKTEHYEKGILDPMGLEEYEAPKFKTKHYEKGLIDPIDIIEESRPEYRRKEIKSFTKIQRPPKIQRPLNPLLYPPGIDKNSDVYREWCRTYKKGVPLIEKINAAINSDCQNKDIIPLIKNNQTLLATESGLGDLSEKYGDELRNVWEIYAKEAHTKYKLENNKYTKFQKFMKDVKQTFWFGDAVVAFLQGALPGITSSGLIRILKSINENDGELTGWSAILFVLSTVLPIYVVFMFNFIKVLNKRTMKHSPLKPFLVGTALSMVMITVSTTTDVKFLTGVNKNEASRIGVIVIFSLLFFLTVTITIYLLWVNA